MGPSRQSRIVAFVMRWFVRPLGMVFARPRFVPLLRWFIEAITPRPRQGHARGAGPARRVGARARRAAQNRDEAILYLHGSGYVVCSPQDAPRPGRPS